MIKKLLFLIPLLIIALIVLRRAGKQTPPTHLPTDMVSETPSPLGPGQTAKKSYPAGNFTASLRTPDGRDRTYLVHIPPGYSPDNSYPLVIAFHGTGGQGANQEHLSKFSSLADQEGFVAVYPDGLYKEWNDGRGDSRPEAERIDDVTFISLLIDKLIANLAINPAYIYTSGMSNGASFSQRIACALSSKIAGASGVGSEMGQSFSAICNPNRAIPIVLFHGDSDPVSPYGGGKARKGAQVLGAEQSALFWAKKNGCNINPTTEQIPDLENDGTTVTRIHYTGCRNNADVILYRINGGGHAWPGGMGYAPEFLAGKNTHDINATELIWDFFKSHM